MINLNLKLEETLDQQLSAVCDKRGYEKDTLIRNLIVNYLRKENPGMTAKLSRANFSSLMTIIETDSEFFAELK